MKPMKNLSSLNMALTKCLNMKKIFQIFKSSKRKQLGFSLAEVIIAGGLFLIIGAAISKFMAYTFKSASQTQIITGLNNLTSRITDLINNPAKLTSSVNYTVNGQQMNAALQACINSPATCNTSGSPGGVTPFYLVAPSTGNSGVVWAGPATNPTYYSPTGSLCPNTGSCSATQYPIEAIAGFSNTPAGVQPQGIYIYFCVRLRNNSNSILNGLASTNTSNFPSCTPFVTANAPAATMPLLRPSSALYVPTNTPVALTSMAPCPSGQAVTGLNSDGSFTCGRVALPNASSCPNGYVVSGLNADGTVTCTNSISGSAGSAGYAANAGNAGYAGNAGTANTAGSLNGGLQGLSGGNFCVFQGPNGCPSGTFPIFASSWALCMGGLCCTGDSSSYPDINTQQNICSTGDGGS